MVTDKQFEQAMTTGMPSFQRLVHVLRYRMGDADDMLQEGLTKAYERRQQFRGESLLSTWIYQVIRNRCLMQIRKDRFMVELDAIAHPVTPAVVFNQILVKELLDNVPKGYRTMLTRWMEGIPLKEIARRSHVSLNTTKARIHRMVKKLSKLCAVVGKN